MSDSAKTVETGPLACRGSPEAKGGKRQYPGRDSWLSWLKKRTDADWQKWSKIDPYYAVLTIPKYRKNVLPQNRDEFFSTGEEYIEQILDTIGTHFGPIPRRRALDFGCGVGRLVIPLARRFDEVVGVDIAHGMLEEAQKNCRNSKIRNVIFTKSDDDLSSINGKFTLINSYLVLQHISRKRGFSIIERLLRTVEPTGVIVLHVSILRRLPLLSEVSYVFSNFVPGGSYLINLCSARRLDEPPMRASRYDLLRILERFLTFGFPNVLISQQDHGRIVNLLLIAQRVS